MLSNDFGLILESIGAIDWNLCNLILYKNCEYYDLWENIYLVIHIIYKKYAWSSSIVPASQVWKPLEFTVQ